MGKKVVIIAVFTLLLLGMGTFYMYRGAGGVFSSVGDITAVIPPPLAEGTPVTQEAGEGQRKYSNAGFHFSLIYPDTLVAREYTEQGGALTVSFEDPNTTDGFQIYVTPYNESYITPQRFKTDEPSGVIREQTDVLVGGVRATMFFGKNPLMGDTREVWFIKNGLLYEVSTYKDLDPWLSQIMTTWQFL